MLYLLEKENGTLFYIINNEKYEVGRKDCDITILNDQSISRQHAVFQVKNGSLSLKDCSSKYGTFLNNSQLTPDNDVPLKDGDTIKFGVFQSCFKMNEIPIVTTTSQLKEEQKSKLKADIGFLNGKVVPEWTKDVTHLTIEEVTFTIKVLLSVVNDKPIVTPKYWTKFVKNVKLKIPPPETKDYQPRVAETILNKVCLEPKVERKTIFTNKVFVFLNEKAKKQMEEVIVMAGGECISLETTQLKPTEIKKSTKEYIIVQAKETSNTNLTNLLKYLSETGQRTIPLSEIAMSVMFCSCEKDCNPKFNRAAEVFAGSSAHTPPIGAKLVENTQSQYFSASVSIEPKVDVIIPQSYDDDDDMPLKKVPVASTSKVENMVCGTNLPKRSIAEDNSEHPYKKMKLQQQVVEKEKNQNGATDNGKVDQKLCDKRKEMASIDKISEPPEKKQKQNPFVPKLMKSKSNIDKKTGSSSFASLKKLSTQSSSINLENNPFVEKVIDQNIKKENENKRENPNIHCSTFNESQTSHKSFKSDATTTTSSPGEWCSKDTAEITQNIIKEDPDCYDEEVRSFIEKFKNVTVLLSVSADIFRKPVNATLDNTDSSKSTGVNFKKFKKIKPLRVQTDIISRKDFVARQPGNTAEISIDEFYGSDNEDSDGETRPKPNRKRFVFV